MEQTQMNTLHKAPKQIKKTQEKKIKWLQQTDNRQLQNEKCMMFNLIYSFSFPQDHHLPGGIKTHLCFAFTKHVF